jgi:prevent-host-death family protein
MLTYEEMVNRNLILAHTWLQYKLRHYEEIPVPNGAHVIILPTNDPELLQANLDLALKLAADGEQRPVLLVPEAVLLQELPVATEAEEERPLTSSLPTVPVADLRTKMKDVLARVEDQPIVITQRGRPQAVLLDYDAYNEMVERLEILQDAQDVLAAAQAKQMPTEFVPVRELAYERVREEPLILKEGQTPPGAKTESP